VLVGNGPRDTAAGVFAAVDRADLLWTRQVLTTGRLAAVALAPSRFAEGPDGFDTVHELAERIADHLGVGAVEIAVAPWDQGDPVTVETAGYAVTVVAGAPATVLLTDAVLDTPTLTQTLTGLTGAVVALASGASGVAPEPAQFTAVVRTALGCTPEATEVNA
jgi:glutamate N-acetyltransferase/amino-acid N-acetyltransferase